MLAIGRALMARPKLLMLDEPSMGLAPVVVHDLFEKIVEINRRKSFQFFSWSRMRSWLWRFLIMLMLLTRER